MPNDEKTKPVGYASKWLVRVLMAGVLVVLVKGVVGWRFGNPEVVIIFMGTLLLILMGPRWLKFRGTWRITGMLVLMSIAAVAMQFLLVPYNALQRQRAAVQRITAQGGRVNISYATSQYSSSDDVEGWSQTPDGWMVPTFLFRWWEKYLRLGEISELEIPASLMVKDVLQDLQPRSAYRLRILLDGTNQMDPNYRAFFPQLDKSSGRFHDFQSIKDPYESRLDWLTDTDLQLLNSVKDAPIRIFARWPINVERLRQLERPFSFSFEHGGMQITQSVVSLVKESSYLQSIEISDVGQDFWAPLFDALSERDSPIELEICGKNNTLTEAEWQTLRIVKNVRVLTVRSGFEIIKPGWHRRYVSGAELDALAMPDLERLEVSLIDRLPTLCRSPKLQSFVARQVRSFRLEDLRPMTSSSIREVVVETSVLSDGEELQYESWLDHFQHVRINQQTLR